MNIVTMTRIMELSEHKSKNKKLKIFVSNWKNVAIIAITILTVKVAAEQLWMAMR